MLGALLGSVVVLEIVNNEGTEIVIWSDKVLGTTFGAIYIFSLGTYNSTDMGSTDGDVYVNSDVLLLGYSLGSLYGIYVGYIEGTELWLSRGKALGTTLGTYNDIDLVLSW